MASKKYKGKLCVYCADRPSVTGDHIFAREFFLDSERANLPQAPTCAHCNTQKSIFEHYLATVLPFAGRHPSAGETLSTLIPKRLPKNRKLHRWMSEQRSRVWIQEGALLRRTIAIPVDPERIELLFSLIARGLAWHHWGLYFTSEYQADTFMLTEHGQQHFQRSTFRLKAAQRVQRTLGKDAVFYEGVQAFDNPHLTCWRFTMYGGVTMGGDPDHPSEVCSQILVMTSSITRPQKPIAPAYNGILVPYHVAESNDAE